LLQNPLLCSSTILIGCCYVAIGCWSPFNLVGLLLAVVHFIVKLLVDGIIVVLPEIGVIVDDYFSD
jgi:hypothetical protein